MKRIIWDPKYNKDMDDINRQERKRLRKVVTSKPSPAKVKAAKKKLISHKADSRGMWADANEEPRWY